MLLKPKKNHSGWLAFYRTLSVFSIFISLLLLASQTLSLINAEYSPIYLLIEKNPGQPVINTLGTIAFLGCITLMCFFTVFNSKVSDHLQLVPKHTDCL